MIKSSPIIFLVELKNTSTSWLHNQKWYNNLALIRKRFFFPICYGAGYFNVLMVVFSNVIQSMKGSYVACVFFCVGFIKCNSWALLRDCLYPGGTGGKECDANPAQEVFGLFQLCELEEWLSQGKSAAACAVRRALPSRAASVAKSKISQDK